MKNVVADEGIFNLPEDIRVLECRYTDSVNFKDGNFAKLEKLVLVSVKFEENFIKFRNLRKLEITGHLRGDGPDGKRVFCPKLEILRLFKIHHIGAFQHIVANQLKKLHISVFQEVRHTEIAWILRKRPSIKKLTMTIYYKKQIPSAKQDRSSAGQDSITIPGKSKFTFLGKCKVAV